MVKEFPSKMSENKKILNATPLEYDGIQFKSKLEKMAYQTLKEQGFPVQYEPHKYIIWQGLKPNVPFYSKDKVTRMLKSENKKLIDISYTPDLEFMHNGHLIIIEMKGIFNDTYPIKKKMFRKWLEENHPNSVYFEIFSKDNFFKQ